MYLCFLNMLSFSVYMISLFLIGIKKIGCLIKKCFFVFLSVLYFEFFIFKGLKIIISDKIRVKFKINCWL